MLIGRADETAAIHRLLAAARDGTSGVLVVRGEAGVGKSALLDDASENADGFAVLRGTGVEVESELAYAALHQILRPVFDRIERLPEPQAAALRGAFALSSEPVDERFRVSLGVLGLISEVSDERPLLCLVDDAQWLDRASCDALLFAARRLEAEPVALLFAARDDEEQPFAARELPELRVEPLNQADSHALLTERLGSAVAPNVVEWLVESANGNPLALAELPANLTQRQLAGSDPLAGKLPPATSVEQVYLERVDTLPPETRSLLVLAAAEETGARSTVERAAREFGLDIGELAVAESAGLLWIDSERIAFRHPLVRAAIYRGATFTERERAHRTLAVAAAAEGNPDRAAWHRAAAVVGTDDEVARELENTAERARRRSGHAAASSALERAAELSSETDEKGRRLVAAARAAWRSGQPERAGALVQRASPIVTEPLLRADIDHVRGLIELRSGSLADATPILVAGAANVAPFDPHKAFAMLADAYSSAGRSGNLAHTASVARALAALPRSGDEAERLLSDLLVGLGNLMAGETARELPRALEAIARAGDSDDPRVLCWAALGAAAVGDEATQAALLQRAVRVARASGAIDVLVFVLEIVVSSTMLAGRYTVDAEATEGLKLAREAGLTNAATFHLAALAWLAALRGRDDDCRSHAAEVAESVRSSGLANANSLSEWALALLDLGRGRPVEAAARLLALSTASTGVAYRWLVLASTPDLVEACVRTGRHEEARTSFAALDGFAQSGAPNWLLAVAARCRALLSDDDVDGECQFAEALRLHGEINHPYERARTELLYGEFLRRARRRSDARTYLRSALEAFEHLRAEPWADRARGELRATGETARKRDPSTIDQLTPQELQIARLVGQGNSNKEVAAQLFLSPRTVEYHLRKVFAKLGITSRAELIRFGAGELAQEGVAVGAA